MNKKREELMKKIDKELSSGSGETEYMQQESEMGAFIRSMNEDVLDDDTKMTSMDMKARLTSLEMSSILINDSLVALNCLPLGCNHPSRQKKRLSVSLNGLGRKEMVEVFRSKNEQEKESQGFMKRMITPQG